jgi:hypothetical protein
MKALDPDEGINGQIKYSFSKWTLNDKTIHEMFNINPDNGSISLLKQLDYEKRNNYELQIQAKDLGLNPIPSYATVIIQVHVIKVSSGFEYFHQRFVQWYVPNIFLIESLLTSPTSTIRETDSCSQ